MAYTLPARGLCHVSGSERAMCRFAGLLPRVSILHWSAEGSPGVYRAFCPIDPLRPVARPMQ